MILSVNLKLFLFSIMYLLIVACSSTPEKKVIQEIPQNKFYAHTKDEPRIETPKSFFDDIKEKKENFVERRPDCKDQFDIEKGFTQDNSENCIKNQIALAHSVFEAGSPEQSMCILITETTGFDVYSSSKKGNGLAQITNGSWNAYAKNINKSFKEDSPAQYIKERELLDKCVKKLSENTPFYYYKNKMIEIEEYKDLSTMANEIEIAKNNIPSSKLNPFYRDHSICMQHYLLYEKNNLLKKKDVGKCAPLSELYGPSPKQSKSNSANYVKKICNCTARKLLMNRIDEGNDYPQDTIKHKKSGRK